jgi:CO dehydrogenase maturation factor
MKIAVMGKGGSGKTTTSGVLARSLAREGWEVVAIDCDSNPNLGISLGLGIERTEAMAAMRQALDQGKEEHAPTAEEAITRFGSVGPDRVRVAVVTKIDKPQSGCPCCGISPEQLLGELESTERAVIADMEAGLGTLGRMSEASVDVVLLVTEPSHKAIEVARKAAQVMIERKVAGRIVVLANKTRNAADLERVESALRQIPSLADVEIIAVPEDDEVLAADVRGISPIDAAPNSPAVRVLTDLARSFVRTPAPLTAAGA